MSIWYSDLAIGVSNCWRMGRLKMNSYIEALHLAVCGVWLLVWPLIHSEEGGVYR